MQQFDVPSWEHFEERLQSLLDEPCDGITEIRGHVSPCLYRGQSDESWGLTTTLERSDSSDLSLPQYYRLISIVKPQVETVTGVEWDAPSLSTYEEWLTKQEHMAVAPLGYEYMVYLRHHGFPSPLLDWTRSPYIAAYFAFRRAHPDAKSVAIFVYREYLGTGKSWRSSQAHIHGLGGTIRTHRRHFLQQSEYTVCVVQRDGWRYARHEDAFASCEPSQDALWKFRVPATERLKVLLLLDRANLNAYSLLGTDEALLETLAFRELEARAGNL
jgi:hypothetical protein